MKEFIQNIISCDDYNLKTTSVVSGIFFLTGLLLLANFTLTVVIKTFIPDILSLYRGVGLLVSSILLELISLILTITSVMRDKIVKQIKQKG